MFFFDFHTHQFSTENGLINVIFGLEEIPHNKLFSIGLHPWFLNQVNVENFKLKIESIAQNKHFIGIGECGLDKLSQTDFQQQLSAFEFQIQIAEQINKPLIIHCVKAFDELMMLKKTKNPKQKWIIHGFMKNEKLAESLIKQGFYISLPYKILQSESRLLSLLSVIPIEKLFLESDDDKNANMPHFYTIVAQKLGIDLQKLADLIQQNFKLL